MDHAQMNMQTINQDLLLTLDRAEVTAWLGKTYCSGCHEIFDSLNEAIGHFRNPGSECYLGFCHRSIACCGRV